MNELVSNVTGPIVMGWWLFPFHMAGYSLMLIGIRYVLAKVARH